MSGYTTDWRIGPTPGAAPAAAYPSQDARDSRCSAAVPAAIPATIRRQTTQGVRGGVWTPRQEIVRPRPRREKRADIRGISTTGG